MKCGSCRVKGQKSKLSHRHAELGAVKVKKKKLGMFRPAHSSLYLLCSYERGRKEPHFSFFLFTTVMTVILTTAVINIPFASVKVLAVY